MKNRFLSGVVGILAFSACLALTVAGIAISLGATPRPRIVGLICFVLGLGAGVGTLEIWKPVLPGLFALATLNGAVMIAFGHTVGRPDLPVKRLEAIGFTTIFATLTFLTSR